MKKEEYISLKGCQQLTDSIKAVLPKGSIVEMDDDFPYPTAEVTYTDFKPVREVREMLTQAFPDVEFTAIHRNYSLRAFAQVVFDHSTDRIYTVTSSGDVVPLSLRAYLLSYVAGKEVSSEVDELIKENFTL